MPSISARSIVAVSTLLAATAASYAGPHFIYFTDPDRDIFGRASWSAQQGFFGLYNFPNPGPATNPGKIAGMGGFGVFDDAGGGTLHILDGQADVSVAPRVHSLVLASYSSIINPQIVATGSPANAMDNPSDMIRDPVRNRWLVLDNPGVPLNPGPVDNVLSLPGGGVVNNLYTEPADNPGSAFFQDPVAVTRGAVTDEYMVLCRNGGVAGQGGSQDGNASALWRMTLDASGNVASMNLALDFTTAGLPGLVTGAVGMARVPGAGGAYSLFVTDSVTNSIYRLAFDSTGAYQNSTLVRSGFSGLGEIIFDPYRNQLIFAEEGARLIHEMNFDGSNLRVAVRDVRARGLHVIPTPGALPLLALGSLAALRRRR